ncbi:multidrug effflux MFS transporter [Macrococcoides canis]|uniref:multidrug effflux MFS transporter n=1 Tax=Macrococcoides canis TaxID=1855823 RepID=UPI001AEBCA8A|nr:multidrug effflux MFS transporter [Macrococcus canis]MCO4095970.1 multidrug effflux MFS transporter [Macrococcus canis]QTQ08299.1 multidrug effflux MFS transporter [Macrococcus canis]QUR94427.1 Bcr/CflA family efflux MFS transporter [Macrococcus canis]UTH02639.1 multidrug effflux MFS transporter [Macrococcus canis]UTH07052.1 multidrug effflux MFS transporter [Macrococcus canis]
MKKHNKLILIVTLGLLAAFGPLSLDMYLPALPRVADDLSTSASYAQLSLTACMIGLAVGQIIVGPISDVTGRKKPLFIVLIGYGLFSYFAARAATIEWLIFFRFIQGFCGGAGAVLSRAISSDLYKGKDLTKFLAVLMLVNGLAPVLAPVLGGFILSVSTWHTVFYILAVYGVLMVLLALTLEESLPKSSRNEGALKSIWNDFKLLLTNKAFVTMLLLQSLTYGVLFSYISGSPFITQKIYGMNAQQFSYLFALNGLGLIAFSQLTAKLVNKMDELKILKLGQNIQFIGMMLTVIVLLFHLPVWMLCAAFFLMITPVSMIGTTGFSIAMQVQNQGAGSASAILGLMQFLIGGILSPLVGVMGERSIIPFIVIIIACTVLAQSIRIIWVKNIEI